MVRIYTSLLPFIVHKSSSSFYHVYLSFSWRIGSTYKTEGMVDRRANISHPNPRRQRIRALFHRSALSPFSNSLWKCPLHLEEDLCAILKASSGANSILGRVVYPRPPAAPSRWPLYFKQSGRRELYGI